MLFIGQEPFLRAHLETRAGCESLLGAIRDRGTWIGKDPGQVHEPQSEMWHGSVFMLRLCLVKSNRTLDSYL
jgi:hypothetical protein